MARSPKFPGKDLRKAAECEYVYRSPGGVELFRKVRFGLHDRDSGQRLDKTFGYAYHRPGSIAASDWIRDKPEGADRIPFMLPQLVDAVIAGAPVLLVEGEKDAIAAVDAWGIAATTCHQGAVVGYSLDQIAWFHRADRLRDVACERSMLWIVADRDPTGWAHAWRTRQQLLSGRGGCWDAGHIVVVAPVPEHEGADLADHLAWEESQVGGPAQQAERERARSAGADRAAGPDSLMLVDLAWLRQQADAALAARRAAGGARYWQGSGPYAAGWTLGRQVEAAGG